MSYDLEAYVSDVLVGGVREVAYSKTRAAQYLSFGLVAAGLEFLGAAHDAATGGPGWGAKGESTRRFKHARC